ncbi:hypothetical protein VCJ_000079 [Vibrio metoecus]|nr:hypothetical protein VCJ_000079 [Vibrio metoecus]
MQKRNMPYLLETTVMFMVMTSGWGLANFFILKNKSAAAER